MEHRVAADTVERINALLQQRPWFDFEVMEYQGYALTVVGSIDPSGPHQLEIRFDRVFAVSLPMEWRTDTSRPPLTLLTGEPAAAVNRRFRVEQGHHVFRFSPEDYPEDFGCLIAAQGIEFRIC